MAVPITDPMWVRLSPVRRASAVAMPKSATFTWPSSLTMMLPSFTSRCTSPALWALLSASATSEAISAARSALSGPVERSTSAMLRPTTYSMTM